MSTAIKQQTKDGKTVEYIIREYLSDITIEVRVNGKRYADGKPITMNQNVQGRQVYGQIASVYVSNLDTWNQIWTAYTDAKTTLESSDKYKLAHLRRQREKLAYNLKYANDELHEAHTTKVYRMMQGEAYRYDEDELQAVVDTARAALDAFDNEHPDIIDGLRKERDERTDKNLWN